MAGYTIVISPQKPKGVGRLGSICDCQNRRFPTWAVLVEHVEQAHGYRLTEDMSEKSDANPA